MALRFQLREPGRRSQAEFLKTECSLMLSQSGIKLKGLPEIDENR